MLMEWLIEEAVNHNSKWIEKKTTLLNELYRYVKERAAEDKVQLFLERIKPRIFFASLILKSESYQDRIHPPPPINKVDLLFRTVLKEATNR